MKPDTATHGNTIGGTQSGAANTRVAVADVTGDGRGDSAAPKNGGGETLPTYEVKSPRDHAIGPDGRSPIIAVLIGLLLPAEVLQPNAKDGDLIRYKDQTGTIKFENGKKSIHWGDGSVSQVGAPPPGISTPGPKGSEGRQK